MISIARGYERNGKEKRDELETAIHAMKEHPGAFLLEVRVEPEENVFPMVPAGAAVGDVRLE